MTSRLYKQATSIDAVGGPINEGRPSDFTHQQLHEKNCGWHALNNIVQHNCFSMEYLNAIEKEQFGQNFTNELFMYGYKQSTLLRALEEYGYTCTPAPKIKKKNRDRNTYHCYATKTTTGFPWL